MNLRSPADKGVAPGARRPARARVRSHWFRSEKPRGPEELAGAAAFIVWRVAHQVLRNMRNAAFEIDAGPRYFEFLCEWLVYLAQQADRMAYERFEETRVAFTTAMVNRLGETLADNYADLLGDDGRLDRKSAFIDFFNLRLDDYVEFGPDGYSRMRYLARMLSQQANADDRLWVHEQVMEIEAPHAAGQLAEAMLNLLGEGPKRARTSTSVSGE